MKPLGKISTSLLLLTLVIMQEGAGAATLTQEAALNLIKKSGCVACHAVDKLKMGPAYLDVAKRYATPNAELVTFMEKAGTKKPADFLFQRIRKGVRIPDKHWKEAKGMMTPNPVGRISDENLKSLVEYILSLK